MAAATHMRSITITMTMPNEPDDVGHADCGAALARLRLLQLASPGLPVGGFTYSQGLEWAVEAGWLVDRHSVEDWLSGLLVDSLATWDLALLARLYRACERADRVALSSWGQYLLAGRETRELRVEERNRARAMTTLLVELGVPRVSDWRAELACCQAAPFALAAQHWGIALDDCLLGYAWTWLEGQVAAAIKLVPLGQSDGQRVQLALAARVPAAVATALSLNDDQLGAGAPALAIASARHETQYTRLFRS